MTETRTKPRRERRSLLFQLSDDQVLPRGLKGVPKPIAEANERALEAIDRSKTTAARRNETAEQAKAAPRFDELAAEAAVAAGEEIPPATVADKRAAALDAERESQAAERIAKIRVRELYDTVEDHYDAYLEPRLKAAEQLAEPLSKAIPSLLDRLVEFRTENAVYRLALSWHNNPNSAALSPSASTRDRARYDRALEDRRALNRLRPNAHVENDIVTLLAALAVKLEDELTDPS